MYNDYNLLFIQGSEEEVKKQAGGEEKDECTAKQKNKQKRKRNGAKENLPVK